MTDSQDTVVQIRLMTRLVEIRKASGLPLKQVARRLNVTPAAVSQFEHAVRDGRSPTLRSVLRYAQVVGADIRITPQEQP